MVYMDYAGKIRRTLERIKNSKIPPGNKAILYRFHRANMADPEISVARQDRLLGSAFLFTVDLNKPLTAVKKNDIEKLVSGWNQRKDLTPMSRQTMIAILKKFFKWFKGKNEFFPPVVSWIKNGMKEVNKTVLNENELYSETDIEKMLEAADNDRDRCIVALLFDTGMRPKELATLRYNDVIVTPEGTSVHISQGKTGQRTADCVLFPVIISRYLEVHPTKKPDDYLFMGDATNNRGDILSNAALRRIVNKILEKAKITGKKRILYLFRHSRASKMAREDVPQQAIMMQLGHRKPETTQKYLTLSGTYRRNALNKAAGKAAGEEEETEEQKKAKLKPKKCPRCRFVNDAILNFCGNCGAVLDLVTAQKMQSQQQAALEAAVDARFEKLAKAEQAGKLKAALKRRESIT